MDKTQGQTMCRLLENWLPAASAYLRTLTFIPELQIGVVQPVKLQFHTTA